MDVALTPSFGRDDFYQQYLNLQVQVISFGNRPISYSEHVGPIVAVSEFRKEVYTQPHMARLSATPAHLDNGCSSSVAPPKICSEANE
jgi:hypothetical protein